LEEFLAGRLQGTEAVQLLLNRIFSAVICLTGARGFLKLYRSQRDEGLARSGGVEFDSVAVLAWSSWERAARAGIKLELKR
jgi:hypothetical protein